jgi:hypothetical protein
MQKKNINIKEIAFKYSGKLDAFELPPDCSLVEKYIILYKPFLPVSDEAAYELYRNIESIFAIKLLLDDEPYELRFSKWVVPDERGFDHEIHFADGTYTIGIRNFEAKPIKINDLFTFNFQDKAKNYKVFLNEINNWLKDDDLEYMLDSYNIGRRKGTEELFYMYSVYECLKYKNRSGEKFIINELGLSNDDKIFIHNYCNNKNIRISRHSGRNAGKGNDAGGMELQRLRSIIKELIIRYAYYLSNYK